MSEKGTFTLLALSKPLTCYVLAYQDKPLASDFEWGTHQRLTVDGRDIHIFVRGEPLDDGLRDSIIQQYQANSWTRHIKFR